MKKIFLFICCALISVTSVARSYEEVKGDPMKTRIYTLDNGLKVYLSVNKEHPRITAHIAVNTGSKNDPAEYTGLAHYLEHLMLKGTPSFGTANYEAEKPLLDKICSLYEEHRTLTDPAQRRAKYHEIDSVSQIAAQYFIPNEYDKMMTAIGSQGTNAFTSYDVTCYVEDIPSNELERWCMVQSDRFQNMVMRGFHTELEAVYEEKNISMTKDNNKAYYALLHKLFPSHSYGTQTTIGTQEHLKNPSQVAIMNYYKKYYVPNNIAICMAGDLDPDKTIAMLEQYFGSWKNDGTMTKVPGRTFPEQPVFTAPSDTTVLGKEIQNVAIAWRMKGASSLQIDTLTMMDMLLSNGKVGLIDTDLNNKMKTLGAGSNTMELKDYSLFLLSGSPNEGQTLDEVKDLLLAEVEKLKNGDWDEGIMKSIIANAKLSKLQSLDSNVSRVRQMVDCFIDDVPWEQNITQLDRLSKLTKADIISWAKEHITDGYVVLYKRQGEDTTIVKIDKPEITPISSNRNMRSKFMTDFMEKKVEDIQPQFIDFNKELTFSTTKNGLPVIYKQNTTDDRFFLSYRFDFGELADMRYDIAAGYMGLLGTNKKSLEQIQRDFYDIACSYGVSVGDETTTITVSGLQENMPKAIAMMEDLLQDLKSDTAVYNKLLDQTAKARMESRNRQSNCYSALVSYGLYGERNPFTNVPSVSEMRAMKPETFTELLKGLTSLKHEVIYWGPQSLNDMKKTLEKCPSAKIKNFKDVPENKYYTKLLTTENEVYLAPYDAPNINMRMIYSAGKPLDIQKFPLVSMFNEYFGGGMNAIVFQELRETRGLAYNAWARYNTPGRKGDTEYYNQHIISQNDKMIDCINTFKAITDTIPQSEAAFNTAKQNWMKSIAAQRTVKAGAINRYIAARRLGIDYDINKMYWEAIPKLTLQDVVNFEQENIKGKPMKYLILGKEKDLDVKALEKLGPVKRLTLDDIFPSYK